MNQIRFEKGIPYRGFFRITEWCVLGDCNQPECHHCFPVKDCKKHELCQKEGTCKYIPIPNEKNKKLGIKKLVQCFN